MLHGVATWLVFRLCLRLTGSEVGAGIGAVLFAVHPIHVDAVTWVSASNEVLFTIFVMGALLLLLEDGRGRRVRVWGSAGLFCLGIFSKETAVALLPVLIGVAWVQLGNSGGLGQWGRAWKASAPYLAATAFYEAARWSAIGGVRADTPEHSWAEVIFSSPSIVLFYLKKLVVPVGLSPVYMNAVAARPTARFWMELLAILLGVMVVSWIAIKYRSEAAVAAGWVVLPIVPALAVLRLYPEGDMTHDRYLYAPSVGVSIMAAMAVKYVWSRREKKATDRTGCGGGRGGGVSRIDVCATAVLPG